MGGSSNPKTIDKSRDLYPHAILFDVYIRPLTGRTLTGVFGASIDYGANPYYHLVRILRRGKNPNPVRGGFKIKNLPLGKYEVVFDPLADPYTPTLSGVTLDVDLGNPSGPVSFPGAITLDNLLWGGKATGTLYGVYPRSTTPTIYTTTESETYTDVDTLWNWYSTGPNVQVSIEGLGTISQSDAAEELEHDLRKRSTSAESGAPMTITSVSEIVSLEAVEPNPAERTKLQSLPGIALLGVKSVASERLRRAPSVNVLITGAREIRNFWAAGTAGPGSSGATLVDTSTDFNLATGLAAADLYIRNLRSRSTRLVTGLSATSVTGNGTLDFSPGDEYVIWSNEVSSYFPDIFIDTLLSDNGGTGAYIDQDVMIDYPSIVRCRQFCVDNDLFFDGVVQEKTPWARWATLGALSSLLYPARINGKLGLKPEDFTANPVAVFNASNIIKGSFQESYLPWFDQNVNKVTLTYLDGRYTDFNSTTLTFMTEAVYLGLGAKLVTEEALDMPYITHEKQAILVGSTYLKSRREQNKAVSFETSPVGLFLVPGDIIIVQHRIVEYDQEFGGFVTEAGTFSGVNQDIALSRLTPLTLDDFVAAVWRKSDGSVQSELPISPATLITGTRGFTITGLTAQLNPGDYVVVGKTSLVDSYYRISSLNIRETANIKISATIWSNRLADFSDILYSPSRRLAVWFPDGDLSPNWAPTIAQGFTPLSGYTFPF